MFDVIGDVHVSGARTIAAVVVVVVRLLAVSVLLVLVGIDLHKLPWVPKVVLTVSTSVARQVFTYLGKVCNRVAIPIGRVARAKPVQPIMSCSESRKFSTC